MVTVGNCTFAIADPSVAKALPRSVIVGSVEIAGCHEGEDGFVWELANPVPYPNLLVPHGVPQPEFYHPTF